MPNFTDSLPALDKSINDLRLFADDRITTLFPLLDNIDETKVASIRKQLLEILIAAERDAHNKPNDTLDISVEEEGQILEILIAAERDAHNKPNDTLDISVEKEGQTLKLSQVVYAILIRLAERYPLNDEDPISFAKISDTPLDFRVYLAVGHVVDLNWLVTWFSEQNKDVFFKVITEAPDQLFSGDINKYTHPLRAVLTIADKRKLEQYAKEKNIPINTAKLQRDNFLRKVNKRFTGKDIPRYAEEVDVQRFSYTNRFNDYSWNKRYFIDLYNRFPAHQKKLQNVLLNNEQNLQQVIINDQDFFDIADAVNDRNFTENLFDRLWILPLFAKAVLGDFDSFQNFVNQYPDKRDWLENFVTTRRNDVLQGSAAYLKYARYLMGYSDQSDRGYRVAQPKATQFITSMVKDGKLILNFRDFCNCCNYLPAYKEYFSQLLLEDEILLRNVMHDKGRYGFEEIKNHLYEHYFPKSPTDLDIALAAITTHEHYPSYSLM